MATTTDMQVLPPKDDEMANAQLLSQNTSAFAGYNGVISLTTQLPKFIIFFLFLMLIRAIFTLVADINSIFFWSCIGTLSNWLKDWRQFVIQLEVNPDQSWLPRTGVHAR